MIKLNHSGIFPSALSPIAQSGAAVVGLEEQDVRSQALPIFFPRIDDCHCNRIQTSFTAVFCFDSSLRKQPVAWKEFCAEHWLKELQESMDRFTGRRYVTEIPLKRRFIPYNQSINFLEAVVG